MKYRFEITYEKKEMIQANDFMKKLDLGEGRVCVCEKIELTTSRDYAEIEKIKNAIKECYELLGAKVWYIQGGTWE